MPTFPKYYGSPLPEVLNPFNLYHYLLLLDWVFFKPSRFKQYLYRVDPDLYRQRGIKFFWQAVRFPAYGNLIGMALCLTIVLSIVFPLLTFIIRGAPPAWSEMFFYLVLTFVAGVMMGGLGLVIKGVAAGVFMGVGMGLAFGGLASMRSITGVAGSVFLWVIFGTGMNLAASSVMGAEVGVGFGVTASVLLSVGVGLILGAMNNVEVRYWGYLLAASMTLLGTPMMFGVVRGGFYVFQIVPATWLALKSGPAVRRLSRHPALVDELAVLPFPGLTHLLHRALEEDFPFGLQCSRALLGNPFQRWVVGRAFTQLFAHETDPLGLLYKALPVSILDEFETAPLFRIEFRYVMSPRILLLSEVTNIFSHEVSDFTTRAFERFAWNITRFLRGKSDSRIVPLGKLLLALLDGETLENVGLAPNLLAAAGDAVQALPHGCELQRSFALLAAGLTIADLPALAAQQSGLADYANLPEPPLRPQIVQALQGLGDVTTEVANFLASTSPTTQASALNRAIGMLNELGHYIVEINLPEQALLRLVIHHWQDLVAKAAGRLGEQALRELEPDEPWGQSGTVRRASFWARPLEPYPNPYKAGDPVYPPLFVGRQDITNFVRQIWNSKANPDSIILYGHRRMGKSSILRNLSASAPAGSLLVIVDLKGQTAFVSSTAALLRGLADEITWAAQDRDLPYEEADAEDYHDSTEAALAFRRLVRRVLTALPSDSSLILALDEFEAIDSAVSDGRIDRKIYDYLRELSQQPRVVLIFAGLHTLDEMSRDYRQAFFNSYINIRVSYLPQPAAERLIMRPTPDFPLNYASEVVQRIIIETHGQPLLVQCICQELVNRINYELFDLNLEREARVLSDDLTAVLNDDFLRSDSRYFDGIWSDQIAGDDAASEVLRVLSSHGPLTAKALVERIALPLAQITATLDYLEVRDLVWNTDGIYDIRIPLMGRWLQLKIANTHSA